MGNPDPGTEHTYTAGSRFVHDHRHCLRVEAVRGKHLESRLKLYRAAQFSLEEQILGISLEEQRTTHFSLEEQILGISLEEQLIISLEEQILGSEGHRI